MKCSESGQTEDTSLPPCHYEWGMHRCWGMSDVGHNGIHYCEVCDAWKCVTCGKTGYGHGQREGQAQAHQCGQD